MTFTKRLTQKLQSIRETAKLQTGSHQKIQNTAHFFVEARQIAWVLLVVPFFGLIGVHRFYMGKIVTGIIWLVTGGLFGIGWLYDLWTLNEQVSEINARGI